MLAEIFMLRLEAMARVAAQEAPSGDEVGQVRCHPQNHHGGFELLTCGSVLARTRSEAEKEIN